MPANDLALLAHRLDRRSYLHDPFRTMFQTGWLWWPGRPPLPCPRSARRARTPRGSERDEAEYQTAPTHLERASSLLPQPHLWLCAAPPAPVREAARTLAAPSSRRADPRRSRAFSRHVGPGADVKPRWVGSQQVRRRRGGPFCVSYTHTKGPTPSEPLPRCRRW